MIMYPAIAGCLVKHRICVHPLPTIILIAMVKDQMIK
jgi:hypothetical protein